MPGTGFKSQIGQAMVAAIKNVTTANGYSQDVVTVAFDKIRVAISDYADYELPAVQVIDLSKGFEHQFSRSKSSWLVAVEIIMRSTETVGVVDQQALWDLQENVMREIMKDPKLGLDFVLHVKLLDEVTDLHLQSPNYIATIGLEILYYEPVTRDNC